MKVSQEVVERWRQLVESFESQSGMSRRSFCDGNHIKTHQLDYWRRRLRRTERIGPASADSWIPLRIRDDRRSGLPSGISLRVGSVEIDVQPGFDRQLLADVLAAVGASC
jgi:hypothetical protein